MDIINKATVFFFWLWEVFKETLFAQNGRILKKKKQVYYLNDSAGEDASVVYQYSATRQTK